MIRKDDLIKQRPTIGNRQHMPREYYRGPGSGVLPAKSGNLFEKQDFEIFEKFGDKNSLIEEGVDKMKQSSAQNSKNSTTRVDSERALHIPKSKVKIVKELEKELGPKSTRSNYNEVPSFEIENTNNSSCKEYKQKLENCEERKRNPSLEKASSQKKELNIDIHNCNKKNGIEEIAERAITEIKSRIHPRAQHFAFETMNNDLKKKQLQEELGQIKEAITLSETTQKKLGQDKVNLKQAEVRIRKEQESNLPQKVKVKRSVVVLKPHEKNPTFLFQTMDLTPTKKDAWEVSQKAELASSLEHLKRQQASINTRQALMQDRLSVLTKEYKAKEDEISSLNFEKARLSEALEDPAKAIDQMDIDFDDLRKNSKKSVQENPVIRKKVNPTELLPEALSELQKNVHSKRSSLQSKKLDFRKQVNSILQSISESDRERVEANIRAENAISEAVKCEVELQKLREDLENLEQSNASFTVCRSSTKKEGSASRKSRKCYSDVDRRSKRSFRNKTSWISTGAKYGACIMSSAAVFFALGSCLNKGSGPNI